MKDDELVLVVEVPKPHVPSLNVERIVSAKVNADRVSFGTGRKCLIYI